MDDSSFYEQLEQCTKIIYRAIAHREKTLSLIIDEGFLPPEQVNLINNLIEEFNGYYPGYDIFVSLAEKYHIHLNDMINNILIFSVAVLDLSWPIYPTYPDECDFNFRRALCTKLDKSVKMIKNKIPEELIIQMQKEELQNLKKDSLYIKILDQEYNNVIASGIAEVRQSNNSTFESNVLTVEKQIIFGRDSQKVILSGINNLLLSDTNKEEVIMHDSERSFSKRKIDYNTTNDTIVIDKMAFLVYGELCKNVDVFRNLYSKVAQILEEQGYSESYKQKIVGILNTHNLIKCVNPTESRNRRQYQMVIAMVKEEEEKQLRKKTYKKTAKEKICQKTNLMIDKIDLNVDAMGVKEINGTPSMQELMSQIKKMKYEVSFLENLFTEHIFGSNALSSQIFRAGLDAMIQNVDSAV